MHTFNIVVKDNKEGQLVADVVSSHGDETVRHFEIINGVWTNTDINFTNINNKQDASIAIMIQKSVENASESDKVSKDGFRFEIYETNDSYDISKGTLIDVTEHTDFSGETYFTKTYEYEEVGTHNFYYVMKEQIPEEDKKISGMTYSDKLYTFQVVVTMDNY